MLFKEKIIIAVGGYKITDILSVIASSASGKKFRMIINIELFMHEGKDCDDPVRMLEAILYKIFISLSLLLYSNRSKK